MSVGRVLKECGIAHIKETCSYTLPFPCFKGIVETAPPEEVHPLERYKLWHESNDEHDDVIFCPQCGQSVESRDCSDNCVTILILDDEQTGIDSLEHDDSEESVHTVYCIKETFFSKGKPLEEPRARSSHRTAHDLGDKRGVHRKRWNSSFRHSVGFQPSVVSFN